MNIYIYIYVCVCVSGFPPLSFKKCNKLDEYIYTYFFIIPIIPLNNFFYNKDCCWCHKKKEFRLYFFCYIVGVIEINNHG